MGDQYEYCNRLTHFGSAIFLDKSSLAVDEIREAMVNIVAPKYVEKAKKLQEIAVKSGSAMKVSESILSAYHDGVSHLITNDHFLPWYQAHAFDLRLTQFVFVFFLPFILYYTYRVLFLCCCCCRKKKTAPVALSTRRLPNAKKRLN